MFRRCAAALQKGVLIDIDGVLIRGRAKIDGAGDALRALDAHGVPWVLLTNGWGREERKAASVGDIIGYPVPTERVVVSHSPAGALHALKGEKVLLSGKRNGADALQNYGFEKAVWSVDHIAAHPDQTPLRCKERVYPASLLEQSPYLRPVCAEPYRAVVVFGEPGDWYCELQVMLDALCTDPATGVLTKAQQIPLYYFNDDFTYAGDHPDPRLAGGALLVCLEALFKRMTGTPLQVQRYGKPHPVQYTFAEDRLNSLSPGAPVTDVYCVGDNIFSDIVGANQAGDAFTSVLVLSGVADAAPAFGEAPLLHVPQLTYPTFSGFVGDLLGEAAGGGAPLAITVITGDDCPLCDDACDLVEALGHRVCETRLASLPAAEQAEHALRIPVLRLPSGAEVGHGRMTPSAVAFKIRRHLRAEAA
eukprot:TRINITY_DN19736_c0_g1_i1.p1 TRINITY_DN19736_c0_g1~~TRINITY_DN19736_c0_g1_i1.p1  ORF type:complete len:419 (+),score=148.01 TRINITY_DN19736_c0_g1_i1:233-1489(+)